MLSQVLPSLSSRSLSVTSRGLPSSWAPTGYGPIALALMTIDLQLRTRIPDHSKCSGSNFHVIPSSACGENSTSSISTQIFSTSSFSTKSRLFRALFRQQALPPSICLRTKSHANPPTRCASTQLCLQLTEFWTSIFQTLSLSQFSLVRLDSRHEYTLIYHLSARRIASESVVNFSSFSLLKFPTPNS